jgi:hypothetical protein
MKYLENLDGGVVVSADHFFAIEPPSGPWAVSEEFKHYI